MPWKSPAPPESPSLTTSTTAERRRSATAREVAARLLPFVDIQFVGHDELWLLTDEKNPLTAAKDLLDRGPSEVVVTGNLAARAEGRPLAERLRWATACAACTVGTAGDWEGLPVRAEIELLGPGPVTRR